MVPHGALDRLLQTAHPVQDWADSIDSRTPFDHFGLAAHRMLRLAERRKATPGKQLPSAFAAKGSCAFFTLCGFDHPCRPLVEGGGKLLAEFHSFSSADLGVAVMPIPSRAGEV